MTKDSAPAACASPNVKLTYRQQLALVLGESVKPESHVDNTTTTTKAAAKKPPKGTLCVLCNKTKYKRLHVDEEQDEAAEGSLIKYRMELENDPQRRVVFCHEGCAQWLPDLYFKEDSQELVPRTSLHQTHPITPVLDAISQRCRKCTEHGAGIRCRSCKSQFYHYPCAVDDGCQLKVLSGGMRPQVEYVMYCTDCRKPAASGKSKVVITAPIKPVRLSTPKMTAKPKPSVTTSESPAGKPKATTPRASSKGRQVATTPTTTAVDKPSSKTKPSPKKTPTAPKRSNPSRTARPDSAKKPKVARDVVMQDLASPPQQTTGASETNKPSRVAPPPRSTRHQRRGDTSPSQTLAESKPAPAPRRAFTAEQLARAKARVAQTRGPLKNIRPDSSTLRPARSLAMPLKDYPRKYVLDSGLVSTAKDYTNGEAVKEARRAQPAAVASQTLNATLSSAHAVEVKKDSQTDMDSVKDRVQDLQIDERARLLRRFARTHQRLQLQQSMRTGREYSSLAKTIHQHQSLEAETLQVLQQWELERVGVSNAQPPRVSVSLARLPSGRS